MIFGEEGVTIEIITGRKTPKGYVEFEMELDNNQCELFGLYGPEEGGLTFRLSVENVEKFSKELNTFIQTKLKKKESVSTVDPEFTKIFATIKNDHYIFSVPTVFVDEIVANNNVITKEMGKKIAAYYNKKGVKTND